MHLYTVRMFYHFSLQKFDEEAASLHTLFSLHLDNLELLLRLNRPLVTKSTEDWTHLKSEPQNHQTRIREF